VSRSSRILVVTGALALTGAVVGALCGVLSVTLALLPVRGFGGFDAGIFALAGPVGGAVGAVTTPLIAWVLLRNVPLGRAILQCAVGTVAGGVLASWTNFHNPLFSPIVGATLGFTVAALHLRLKYARIGRPKEPPELPSEREA
jgi:hypothetical protein